MTPMDRLDERYANDQTFHVAVDVLQKMILALQLTPGELREAAMYAAYRVEVRRPSRFESATPDMVQVLMMIDERLEVRPEFHEAIDAVLRKAGVR